MNCEIINRKYQKGLIKSSKLYVGGSENFRSHQESYLVLKVQLDRYRWRRGAHDHPQVW